MKFQTPLLKGQLIKRYKRFLVDVRLEDGSIITAHCPNSGSMKGLKEEGLTVWLSQSDNPKRKLKETLEIVEVDGVAVGVNTQWPNKLVRTAFIEGLYDDFQDVSEVKSEVKFGEKSRLDHFVKLKDGREIYVEVKNVTLKEGDLALFPDAMTQRGQKHLLELINHVKRGGESAMVYLIQRADVSAFDVARDIDPEYSRLYDLAKEAGVLIFPYKYEITPEGFRFIEKIPLHRSI